MEMNAIFHYGVVFAIVFCVMIMLIRFGMDSIEMDDIYVYIVSSIVASIVVYAYYYVTNTNKSKVEVDGDTVNTLESNSPPVEEGTSVEPEVDSNTMSHLRSSKKKKNT